MSEIVIQGICKKYNKKVALYPFDINFQYGKTVALYGTNGAGKSTLLKILSGVHKQTSGIVKGLSKSKTGYMPDDLVFPESISGFKWLKFLADLKNISKTRVLEVLDQTGLINVYKDDITTYSAGMKQRLLFAQMILSDPDVLLMDEPENCLDPYWVNEWKNRLLEYKKLGKTIIFSSHIVGDINDIADIIVFFHKGRLVFSEEVSLFKQKNKTLNDFFIELSGKEKI
jgi:ABC-type multidrug transport system ATPase subunit